MPSRRPLPDNSLRLLKLYPRETWPDNIGSLSQFWLYQHDSLRSQVQKLLNLNSDYTESKLDDQELISSTLPILQAFLSHLHGHHSVEDRHYFPAFRAIESNLDQGFDMLDQDHDLIDVGARELIVNFNNIINETKRKFKNTRKPSEGVMDYVESFKSFSNQLKLHLEDEEDLVIPLLLQRNQ